jgi:hypothetical protein
MIPFSGTKAPGLAPTLGSLTLEANSAEPPRGFLAGTIAVLSLGYAAGIAPRFFREERAFSHEQPG